MLILFLHLNCNCTKPNYIQALKNADIAFEGIVTKVSDSLVVFKVINPLKQANDSILTIYNDSKCPFNFSENRTYRVFLKLKDNKLYTDNCMGNSLIEGEDEDYRDYSE